MQTSEPGPQRAVKMHMDLLIVEPLDPEVLHWLQSRHAVHHEPALAQDPRAFRRALVKARAKP